MRESLVPYKGHDRLNYLCIIAQELLNARVVEQGCYTLEPLIALCAGFHSLLSTLPLEAKAAIQNLRLLDAAPSTKRGLRLMIERYNDHHARLDALRRKGNAPGNAIARRFDVRTDLTFTPCWDSVKPDDINQARSGLVSVLPIRERKRKPLHDIDRVADVIDQHTGYGSKIRPVRRTYWPPLPAYDLDRLRSLPGYIAWTDLVAMANHFDEQDENAGRQPRGRRAWYYRIHDREGNPTVILQQRSESGLENASGLDLIGIKHLIGLPGAGKTTVLYLLAGVLAQRRHKVCFLFPSIEVASAFIETLLQYGLAAGLLSGQSEGARNRHVLNFGAGLSSQNGGFGVTRRVAPFFATNCAIAGFCHDEELDFPHRAPPCQTIQQVPSGGKSRKDHQCALSSLCGRQSAERELTAACIWAGHVLSLDRGLSPLYSDHSLRHFEFLARTFDLVVVDEADGAQTILDSLGTPQMKLYGEEESLTARLVIDVHGTAARGANAFISGKEMNSMLMMTSRFINASERMKGQLADFDDSIIQLYENQLLTSLSLISDLFPAPEQRDDEVQEFQRRREAFERLWDMAAKDVAYRNLPRRDAMDANRDDEPDEEGVDIEQQERTWRVIGELAGQSVDDMRALKGRLTALLEIWDRDGTIEALNDIVSCLRDIPWLPSDVDPKRFRPTAVLLITVSQVILQHFGLAPRLRLLASDGYIGDEVFEAKPSRDQMGVLPETVVGRLSGARYTMSEEGDVNISHIDFGTTPRLLWRRMIQLGEEVTGSGPAILLTSATSMLETSPSFHIHEGPHYLLRRPYAGEGWARSRYAFMPLRDPANSEMFLKFSGAKLGDRDRVLKAMVDQLLGGHYSKVQGALDDNDIVNGIGRKAGFAVNSYEQCELIYGHIRTNHPKWLPRVRYLVRPRLHAMRAEHAVTASEVEGLGLDRQWDLLIFPIGAIGRGVNIVYQYGERANQAMLGSVYFLTRPHPRSDSLQLMQGLVARASEDYDKRGFRSEREARRDLVELRRVTTEQVRRLMRLTLASSRLGDLAEPFVADQMIIILQTIGRAMRGDCPAFVYFVDQAWAPLSAKGEMDNKMSSMLVLMQDILKRCLSHHAPAVRECYENLYRPFFRPLSDIEGLRKKS